MAGKETGLETTDDPWGAESQDFFLGSWGGSGGGGEYLSWSLKDPQVGKFSRWKEHSRQREQCELSQEGSERCACSWEEEAALG